MSQNRFETRLVLEPAPSRYSLIYLFLVHSLAMAALLQSLLLPPWAQMLLFVGVAISLVGWVRHWWLESKSPPRLTWRVDGLWDYQTRKGEMANLSLLPASFITRWLIVLHLARNDGRRFHVLLLPDSFNRMQWHLLWLRLKFADFD